jgi:hypothetical protein
MVDGNDLNDSWIAGIICQSSTQAQFLLTNSNMYCQATFSRAWGFNGT